MEIIKYPKPENWEELLKRPAFSLTQVNEAVDEIFNEVEKKGDAAILRYTKYFDRANLERIEVSEEEILKAEQDINPMLKRSIEMAYNNIQLFHSKQIQQNNPVEIMPGVSCWQKDVPIDKIGLYVPGGEAPLFSSVLMLAIPAQLAGCKEINLCTPPNEEGKIHPAILYSARKAGVNKIFKIGGIQAIAAMSIGTESVPQSFKLFGPGNQYVTAAKLKALQYGTAIDMPAGPSEVLIVADDSAQPSFIAADLLSQAEHGPDSQVVLVSWDKDILEESIGCLRSQAIKLNRRETIEKSLEHARIILTNNLEEAMAISNYYAPEHLILSVNDLEKASSLVQNAGSVFLGNYSPESAGDYASGTNHTLPTSGFAKAFSGLGTDAFKKKISFQQISKEGLEQLSDTITTMAKEEGLYAHKNAVDIRLKKL